MSRSVLGREAEIAMLAEALESARHGRSASIVLRGDPGIGKTALLNCAVELTNGFRLLRTRGFESESELAFSGLQELFRPVIELHQTLPARQRAVFEGALALGPPVSGDPLAVRAATLSMIAAAAEEMPLLVVVDDAHWLDPPSAEALGFAARRLHQEGVVALFAMRLAEPSAFDTTGLREVTIGGIAGEPALTLLSERARSPIASEVAAELVRVADGNPLALLEFAANLSPAQLAGGEPLEQPVPVGTGIERAFARRLDRLPAETREALLVAAGGELDEPATVAAALRILDLKASALDAAERAGLIEISDGHVRFRHPLVRSVVYHLAASDRPRAVPRRPRGGLRGSGRSPRLALGGGRRTT